MANKIKICFAGLICLSVLTFYGYIFLLHNSIFWKNAKPQLPSVGRSLKVIQFYQRQDIPEPSNDGVYGKGLGFLKVHKAASTTAQSIFLRFGWRRNMTFILPPEKNEFRYPNIISLTETLTKYNILPPPRNSSYDILCHHVFYNRQAWNQYLPAHAPRIGIVREPFDLFRSILRYFRPNIIFSIKSKNPVKTFLNNPLYYEEENARYSLLNNRMAIEYGVDPDIIETRDIARFVNYLNDVLDKDFAVVIVAEMLDESLVLLKRKLGWSLNDILYMSKNVHIEWKSSDMYSIEPTEENKQMYKRLATFDYILYNFFKKKLQKQIARERQFSEEVSYYQRVNKEVKGFCFRDGSPYYPQGNIKRHARNNTEDTMIVRETMWNEEFNITILDCAVMYTDEIMFTQRIRQRQYGKVSSLNWR